MTQEDWTSCLPTASLAMVWESQQPQHFSLGPFLSMTTTTTGCPRPLSRIHWFTRHACLLSAKRWPRAPPPPPPPPPSLLIPRPPWLLRRTPACCWPSCLSSFSGYDHQHRLHKGPAVSVWMLTSTGYHTYAATGWIYILDRNHQSAEEWDLPHLQMQMWLNI